MLKEVLHRESCRSITQIYIKKGRILEDLFLIDLRIRAQNNSNNVFSGYSLWISEMNDNNVIRYSIIRYWHYLCNGIVLFKRGLG